MDFALFHSRFPEIAKAETRTITILRHDELPLDESALLESYCERPDCDCRQVMLSVVSRRRQQLLRRHVLRRFVQAFRLDEAEQERLRQQAAAEAEARRIRELEALAAKEEDTWTFARQLLEQGCSHYDEVVDLLIKLRDLAIHQGTEEKFEARL